MKTMEALLILMWSKLSKHCKDMQSIDISMLGGVAGMVNGTMMNMNKHIVTNTNEESMNMPSYPTLLNKEVIHYYVDAKGLEEGDVGSEEPFEGDDAHIT